ncbi:MAG: hypothetical protein AAF713_13670 [Pseudomonadota bacterium]
MHLGVVYLARQANHPRWLRFFLDSLQRHPAGAPYDLLVIQKGYPSKAPDPALIGFQAPGLQAIHLHHASDATFATNTFFDLARAVEHTHLLYFVSWARVLAPDWARIMTAAAAAPGCGIVGASAGYEPLNDTTPFPNRSIRTTGFLVARALWLSLDPGPLTRKYDGNLFEAGPNSLTRQVEARGLLPVVAGRDGRVWGPEDWPESRTFRSGDQENLLFADNRTQDYAMGSLRRRRKLARLNWGDAAEVATVPPWTRLARRLAWSRGGQPQP